MLMGKTILACTVMMKPHLIAMGSLPFQLALLENKATKEKVIDIPTTPYSLKEIFKKNLLTKFMLKRK